jgi:hypothetical protein
VISVRRIPLLLAAALLCLPLGGCGGNSDGGTPAGTGEPAKPGAGDTTAADLVSVKVDTGTVRRPASWQASSAREGKDHAAQFLQVAPDGKPVAQLDVFIGKVPQGAKADALMAAVQGARAAQVRSLRETRREFTEVPGAASAFLTESTYLFPDGRTEARSIEILAVTGDGDELHVRLSATAGAYDATLFQRVLESMSMTSRGTA